MTIRVLVVDDQPMFRVGLVAILGAQADLEVVGEAGDGAEALVEARRLDPDVVLMDVRMPVMNGIEAASAMLADARSGEQAAGRSGELPGGRPGRRPKVVMLTTFDIDDYVFAALRAGASGFLLKDAAPEDLVGAVRTVHAGEALLSPRVTRRLVEAFASVPPRREPAEHVVAELTDREREVFELMATGRSNAEIARDLFIAEQTTKSHVSRILTKLGLRDRVHAVVLAYESGIAVPGQRGPEG